MGFNSAFKGLNNTVGGTYRNYCTLNFRVTLGLQFTAIFTCSHSTTGTAVSIFISVILAAITVNLCDASVQVLVRYEYIVMN
jgi:hypothetical protein